MHRVLIVQAYCPAHGELRMMFPPRPIDNEKCPVCAGPVLAHILGWGSTSRNEEIAERLYVSFAELNRRRIRQKRRLAEAAEGLALARR